LILDTAGLIQDSGVINHPKTKNGSSFPDRRQNSRQNFLLIGFL